MVTVPHVPVMLEEALEGLRPQPGGRYIDGTIGAGGHAAALLTAAGSGATLLGLDADPEALTIARSRLEPFGDNAILVETNFRFSQPVAEELGFTEVDGILLDLGISSMQLRSTTRGFSFTDAHALDMRFGPHQHLTAADVVNRCPEAALADLIYRYGEEPASRRIARAIVAARPVSSSAQLADTVAMAVGRRGRTHPATRTLQALRIAVNNELDTLREALPQALHLLRPGGRLVVISFHSLEDRIVKEFFQQESRDCVCPPAAPVCVCNHKTQLKRITRRALRPRAEEVAKNPPSRSAKFRVAEKL